MVKLHGICMKKHQDADTATNQSEKIMKFKVLDTQKGISNQRKIVKYIFFICTPDLWATFQFIAPGSDSNT